MQEGLNATLVLSSANLIGLIGIFVKLYMSKQPRKLEQPIEIRPCSASTEKGQCDERHRLLNEQVTCLFARTENQGKQQAAITATQEAVQRQLDSMDSKLDKLIARKG